jgi:hypothetical protein
VSTVWQPFIGRRCNLLATGVLVEDKSLLTAGVDIEAYENENALHKYEYLPIGIRFSHDFFLF